MDYLSFKIFDRLYCIGDKGASSYIIDSGEGLVMIDTGYLEGSDKLIASMTELGLSLSNVKHIVHTHGHIDHFGATKKLVSLTNAKTYLGAPDRAAANGEKEMSFAKELGMEFTEYFEPDVLLYDGDVLTFGDINIKCVATPGHTAGAFSYFFTLGGKRFGIHGGAGLNTLVSSYLDKMELPYALRIDFLGKKGQIAELMKGLRDVADKKAAGQLINGLKNEVEEALGEAVEALRKAEIEAKVRSAKKYNPTLKSAREMGSYHPITLATREVESIFTSMGFTIEKITPSTNCLT